MDGNAPAPSYTLGHSERELKRLSVQASLFEPFTARMLQQAGISHGMRVLDVGSGTGDVAFLVASLAGPAGEVIGIDKSPSAVETARERARSAGVENVSFEVGDVYDTRFDQPFDAVVGRLVLIHQPDPVRMLRKLSGVLRAGGIIAFQEFDISGTHSFPVSQTFERCLAWVSAAFAATGTDARMGPKLYAAFIEAGFPAPLMSLDAGIWGGEDNPAAAMITEVIRSLLPVLEKTGIASEAEVDIPTVEARISNEIGPGGVLISPALIGAWANLP